MYRNSKIFCTNLAGRGVKLSPRVRAPCSTEDAAATAGSGSSDGDAKGAASDDATVLGFGTAVPLEPLVAVLVMAAVTALAGARMLEGCGNDTPRLRTGRVAGIAEGGGIIPMAIGAAGERTRRA